MRGICSNVLGGFVIGLAISIAVGQLDKLLGFEARTMNFVPDILLIAQDIGQTHLPTLVVGLVSLGLLFSIDKFIPKLPGAITVVVLSIVLSGVLDFEAMGIHIVGDIPAGLPPIGLPSGIALGDIFDLLPGAVAIALVGFAGKILGPLGIFYYMYLGKWTFPALIMNVTNDFIWLIPFAVYLFDSFLLFRKSWTGKI